MIRVRKLWTLLTNVAFFGKQAECSSGFRSRLKSELEGRIDFIGCSGQRTYSVECIQAIATVWNCFQTIHRDEIEAGIPGSCMTFRLDGVRRGVGSGDDGTCVDRLVHRIGPLS